MCPLCPTIHEMLLFSYIIARRVHVQVNGGNSRRVYKYKACHIDAKTLHKNKLDALVVVVSKSHMHIVTAIFKFPYNHPAPFMIIQRPCPQHFRDQPKFNLVSKVLCFDSKPQQDCFDCRHTSIGPYKPCWDNALLC